MSEPIISKRCTKCQQVKPVSEFHKRHDRPIGLVSRCKQCLKAYHQSPKGRKVIHQAKRKYRQTEKGREVELLYKRKYSRTKKGREANRRYKRKYNLAYPDRKKAQHAIEYAVATSRIPPANTLKCEHCGKQAQHYHHPDYSKPLEVISLCCLCHTKAHRFS